MSPEEFFCEWVPTQFDALDSGSLQVRCTVLVEIAEESYVLSVDAGRLEAKAGSSSEVSFRLRANRPTFERLIAPAAAQEQKPTGPLLKLLNLDQEAIDLVGNVPGALQLQVQDGDTTYELAFGPGKQPVDPPGCSVKCQMADLLAMQAGTLQPMELLMSGRLEMDGDLQIAMALGGVALG